MARSVGGFQQQRSVRLWDPGASTTRVRRNCNAGHSTLHYLQPCRQSCSICTFKADPQFHAKAFSLLVYIEEQMPARLFEKTHFATFACSVEVKMP